MHTWVLVVALCAAAAVLVAIFAVPLPTHRRGYRRPPAFAMACMGVRRYRVRKHIDAINRDHCNALLHCLDDACRVAAVEFWLTEGTALGAVRERDFIANDSDVDVGMTEEAFARFYAQVVPAMQRAGCRVYKDNPASRLVTLEFRGEFLDVHAVSATGYCADVPGPCADIWPVTFPLREVQLRDRTYKAPPDAYLERLYRDWRTPRDEKPAAGQ